MLNKRLVFCIDYRYTSTQWDRDKIFHRFVIYSFRPGCNRGLFLSNPLGLDRTSFEPIARQTELFST
jgi:hypothetical protein